MNKPHILSIYRQNGLQLCGRFFSFGKAFSIMPRGKLSVALFRQNAKASEKVESFSKTC